MTPLNMPSIIINGQSLTPAQSDAVRQAVTWFNGYLLVSKASGPISDGYRARLSEVSGMLIDQGGRAHDALGRVA